MDRRRLQGHHDQRDAATLGHPGGSMNSGFITTDLAEPRDFVSVPYPAVASYAVSPYLQMPTVLTLHDHEVTVEEGPEDLPAWVEPVLDRLVPLADLRPNWDSYGGQPLSRRHGRAALRFLAAVMSDGVPIPDIVPLA